MTKALIWFRYDLRLHDNLALLAASNFDEVIPIFIYEPNVSEASASDWWLHHSLKELAIAIEKHGGSLIIRQGDPQIILDELIQAQQIDALFFNRSMLPNDTLIEQSLIEKYSSKTIYVKCFDDRLLFYHHKLVTKKHTPYKVFSSYWKIAKLQYITFPQNKINHYSTTTIPSMAIDDLNLLQGHQWMKKFEDYWHPGEQQAIQKFEDFVEQNLSSYDALRDFPGKYSTSDMSPYLAWGNISVRSMWYRVKRFANEYPEHASAAESYLRQLAWRDFAYEQLAHFPALTHEPVRTAFNNYPWDFNEDLFLAWKKGQTGYPLVDAGMRELYETGFMHNRVRMVAASFLVKHLRIPWQYGYEWFKETLVDFDMANNAMGWQWVTGSGIDAAPYFRVFNPTGQAEKFDRGAQYIKRWVPELREVPLDVIHSPAKYVAAHQLSYPQPIVDHATARQLALDGFEQIKKH
ncbi:cryptochrome/photolyase family protein [Kurthia huakuii]|uniref:cryptochrome/photolyase family protein n=1 Tax=Kurthia huakuii TaxID=1421019 RepID=UPI0004956049|nr:deoxyribodipyrimidine photo-lyase [Kurthia huakuii]MBM7699871.1 deoxyribodipyrimidine photo-lyase [Kurthia huakuii]